MNHATARARSRREPVAHVQDDAGEEARLGEPKQEPDQVEAFFIPREHRTCGNYSPTDHDAADPPPGPDPMQNQVAGHLEQHVSDIEHAGAQTVDLFVEVEVFQHPQFRETDVHPIDDVDDVQQKQKRQKPAGHLAEDSALVDFSSRLVERSGNNSFADAAGHDALPLAALRSPRCRSISHARTVPSDDLLDHLPFDESQPLVPPEVRVCELVLVEPQLMKDRRVNVAEMVATFDRVQTDCVGGADDRAPLDAAAGHPHGEAQVVVVAALTRFGLGRPAELAAPDDEGRIEQAPALQIGEQGGNRPVGLGGFAEVILFDVVVHVPLEVAGPAAGDHARTNRTPLSTSRHASRRRRP